MWKFDAPYEVQNIDNYTAQVDEAKKLLASLNEQIAFAVEQKKKIELGTDELSKQRMDKIYERENLTEMGEKSLSKKRSDFADEVELFNSQQQKFAVKQDSFNKKQIDFLSEIRLKSDHLLNWENELRVKEDGLTTLEEILRQKDEEHKDVASKISSETERVLNDFDTLKQELAKLDEIRANMLADKEMLDHQKEEVSAMCDTYNAALVEIKKTKQEAEALKQENAKKSFELQAQAKLVRDQIIEQRRIEAENFKKAEALRHQAEQLAPSIQKLEDLKDHIAQTGGVPQ